MRCRLNTTLWTLAAVATMWVLPPASPAQAATLVIEGGTLHPISAAPFKGTLVIVDGKIQALGSNLPIPPGATRIDATGLHVYPGIFDAMSQAGLVEIGSVQATNDSREMGSYNPHLRATTAVHPATELIPVTRANGLTHALTVPGIDGDGVIAGQAAILDFDGWTVEEMTLRPDAAMVLYWPEIQTRSFDFATSRPSRCARRPSMRLKRRPKRSSKSCATGWPPPATTGKPSPLAASVSNVTSKWRRWRRRSIATGRWSSSPIAREISKPPSSLPSKRI